VKNERKHLAQGAVDQHLTVHRSVSLLRN